MHELVDARLYERRIDALPRRRLGTLVGLLLGHRAPAPRHAPGAYDRRR